MSLRAGVLLALCAASCGGGGEVSPDAPPDAIPPDAAPDATPAACRELATSPMPVPLHQAGTVLGGGADLLAPSSCAATDAPFGVESAGVDRVIKLGELTPGTEYGVSLQAAGDLGFYVVTGCSTAAGPTEAECALFVDAGLDGDEEVGRFVATAATAWLVIDTYSSTLPASGAYTVDVYPIACADDGACGGDTPTCLDGRCVGCIDGFDCTTPTSSMCETVTHTCGEGDAICSGDDAAEPHDDGPSGGTMLVLDGTGRAVTTGAICDVRDDEADYLWFVVATAGETWTFELAWTGADDLDLYALDAQGQSIGLSYYEQPETITLTYLAPGTYYVKVDNFDGSSGPAVPYTLTTQRTLGPGCTGPADCAAEYRNQVYRGACVSGACVELDGAGLVPEGGACDSGGGTDCAPGLACPSFYFVADADTREVCARSCNALYGDADCAPLGPSYVCTTYLTQNFCVQRCTEDDHCPTSPGSPPVSPPWYRLSCQTSTGRCLP
jgi:hypothetical protein